MRAVRPVLELSLLVHFYQSWDIDKDSTQFVSQNVFLCIQISTKISSTVSIKVHLSLFLCVVVVGVGA